ncbi:hypothetical protein KM043_010157 [Ampulex compressa]|nr:hypothetical protein KM043_010157 [Ampulex compressa]
MVFGYGLPIALPVRRRTGLARAFRRQQVFDVLLSEKFRAPVCARFQKVPRIMGVTVLQQFPMIENRTGPQTIEFLTKRVVALGAVQTGQFLVDCETYMSVPQLDGCKYTYKRQFEVYEIDKLRVP